MSRFYWVVLAAAGLMGLAHEVLQLQDGKITAS
jgi:hypothetical protein